MYGKNKHKVQLMFYLSIIIISLGLSFFVFIKAIRPVFIKRIEYHGKKIATEVINNAIRETFSDSENKYPELVAIEKNNDGTVAALKSNTIAMNIIRADVTGKIEDELNKIDGQHINIPLGSIFGNEIFAGIGPDVKIKLRPVGLVEVEFFDDFEACGINQSRHTVYIIVSVDIAIITQQAKTSSIVSTKIPISETVIVGDVPKYYGTNSSLKTTLDE